MVYVRSVVVVEALIVGRHDRVQNSTDCKADTCQEYNAGYIHDVFFVAEKISNDLNRCSRFLLRIFFDFLLEQRIFFPLGIAIHENK